MTPKIPGQQLLSSIPNPFLQDRVDSPWQETFRDQPDINRRAFQSCLNSVEAVSRGNQSRGLILHGEPGSGKTHLLQRIRFFTQKEPRTWFVYVPPFTGPGRFWRHLLERIFYDLCQRSKQPESPLEELPQEEGPGQGPLTQIEEALTRHLMARPLDSTHELSRWWTRICQQDAPGEPLFRKLAPTFNTLTVKLGLDPEVMKVLRHYLTWHNRAEAYAYLLGRDLPDEDLNSLEVKGSLDDEERARQAVLTFCHLAGSRFTIILAFDQLEGLQLTVEDLEGLRTFGNDAVDLLSQCGNLLILSAVQTYFLPTLKKALHTSYYHRLAQDESTLDLLTRDSARRFVEFRLSLQEELLELRGGHGERDPLWPFSPRQIEGLVPAGGLSARELIRSARHLFESLITPSAAVPPGPRAPFKETMTRHWEEHFEREIQKPITRVDEGVYEDGILRLFQVKPRQGWKVHRGSQRDLDLLLEGPDAKVGVAISNTENMNSLARRLKRLQDLAGQKRISKLVFLRDARLPISPRAVKTQERLGELIRQGARLVRPPTEAYAALNVLRGLWNKAADNDLTVEDKNISLGELQRWLAEETPRPLRELMDALQEPQAAPEVLTDQLLEYLQGRWVLPLPEAARGLGIGEEELIRFVIDKPEIAGLLAGPPRVLFLHPEAASRYG